MINGLTKIFPNYLLKHITFGGYSTESGIRASGEVSFVLFYMLINIHLLMQDSNDLNNVLWQFSVKN